MLSPQILPYHLLCLAITHLITKIFQNSKITPTLWIYPLMSYHSLSRDITTNHALSLVILITPNPALSLLILSYYHPRFFSELWNHPTPSNLSFDNVIPYPVLSRQILPYHFLSLIITNHITKIFFRTLKSPQPIWIYPLMTYHSLSRAITPNPPLSLVILSYHSSYTKIFQNSEITPPLRTYRLITSFLIPCYHAKSCLITSYP